MKLRVVIIFAVLCFAVAGQAKQTSTNASVQKIYELVHEQGVRVTFIDLRTVQEYNEGHIRGAVSLPVSDPEFSQKIAGLSTGRTYVIYCYSDGRSRHAKRLMAGAGLSVIRMNGGIEAWQRAGYPTVK